VPLVADEDCQTTDSVLRFGQDLCLKDLQISLQIPREQTQTEFSSQSYEDY
jgi:hypothetical protein